jgi:hypothetical protein
VPKKDVKKSKEQMKREFISSLKRLIHFFNNIPNYTPSEEVLKATASF